MVLVGDAGFESNIPKIGLSVNTKFFPVYISSPTKGNELVIRRFPSEPV